MQQQQIQPIHPLVPPIIPQNTVTTTNTTIPSTPPMGIPKPNGLLGSPSKGPGAAGFGPNKGMGALPVPPPPEYPSESITENVANFASSALSLFTGGLTGTGSGSPAGGLFTGGLTGTGSGSPAGTGNGPASDNPFESIGRLTEKWEAKGKSLIAKAGASFDFEQDESSENSGMSNSEIVAKQQRASIMEQKLQVCTL